MCHRLLLGLVLLSGCSGHYTSQWMAARSTLNVGGEFAVGVPIADTPISASIAAMSDQGFALNLRYETHGSTGGCLIDVGVWYPGDASGYAAMRGSMGYVASIGTSAHFTFGFMAVGKDAGVVWGPMLEVGIAY